MKKVRVYITVDLKVAGNLTPKEIEELVAVGKYQDNGLKQEDTILTKDSDFEVEDYIDIEVKDHASIPFIKE